MHQRAERKKVEVAVVLADFQAAHGRSRGRVA
jgi:hypothetical protein